VRLLTTAIHNNNFGLNALVASVNNDDETLTKSMNRQQQQQSPSYSPNQHGYTYDFSYRETRVASVATNNNNDNNNPYLQQKGLTERKILDFIQGVRK